MKILMFFHGGSENRGCEAIVRSAIKVIKAQYPQAYIALASTKPDTDKELALDELIAHYQNRPLKRGSLAYFQNIWQTKVNHSPVISYRLMHQDIIKRIDDFDVFLSIGGDNYCYGDIPDYYELHRLIKAKGKKLVLWGASLGKKDILTPQKLKDLHGFDALLIREPQSEKELKELGLQNVKRVADGAFVLDKTFLPLPTEWEDGNTIGFNYSPLVYKKHPESRAAALALLRHILATTTYKIALTPHVIQSGNDDYECMQSLMEELAQNSGYNRLFLLPNNLNATEYKGFIGRMEVFIGARTHATIAAYSSAVPTMVLGYSIKSLGIAQDLFGYERLVLKDDQINNSQLLIEKFDELEKDKSQIRKILSEKIPEVQQMSMSAANYL